MRKRFRAKKTYKLRMAVVFSLIMLIVLFSFTLVKKMGVPFLLTSDYHLFSIDFDRSKMMLKAGLNYTLKEKEEMPVFNEVHNDQEVRKKIYVYNTHQKEQYVDGSVLDAAYLLRDVLLKKGIEVVVEENDITALVKANNYTYSQSYRVTKELMMNIMADDFVLYVDLHRDSSKKNITTTTIENEDYAKLMFVVGGKHENYMGNYQTAEHLNMFLKNINAQLSRGLLLKKNSSFNQEVSSNVVLIELGGPENTMAEVSRSINKLADAIDTFLGE